LYRSVELEYALICKKWETMIDCFTHMVHLDWIGKGLLGIMNLFCQKPIL